MSTEAPAAPLPDLAETPVSATLGLAPIYDQVNQRRLALLQDMSSGAEVGDIAQMLEIASRYDLDPFAKEIYCSRGTGRDGGRGKLLIMVSRDGLRKVARRNGLRLRGDVIREKDDFKVTWRPEQEAPEISHTYSGISDAKRGPIVGAWAIVYDQETKEPMGFNVAPQVEYMPPEGNKRDLSAWGKTPSIMTLTAAERNALRQATPLSGLLTETDRLRVEIEGTAMDALDDPSSEAGAAANDAFIDALDLETPLKVRIRGAVRAANEVAPGSYPLSKLQMTFVGVSGEQAEVEAAHIEEYVEGQRARKEKAEKEREEEEAITDAEVVPDAEAQAAAAEELTRLRGEEEELRSALERRLTDEARTDLEKQLATVQSEIEAREDAAEKPAAEE